MNLYYIEYHDSEEERDDGFNGLEDDADDRPVYLQEIAADTDTVAIFEFYRSVGTQAEILAIETESDWEDDDPASEYNCGFAGEPFNTLTFELANYAFQTCERIALAAEWGIVAPSCSIVN